MKGAKWCKLEELFGIPRGTAQKGLVLEKMP